MMDTFHQLNVLGRVAINTAQTTIVPTLGACLTSQKNSHAALWKWSHRKRGTLSCHRPECCSPLPSPGYALSRTLGILEILYFPVTQISFTYIPYISLHLQSISRRNEAFDMLEHMYFVGESTSRYFGPVCKLLR